MAGSPVRELITRVKFDIDNGSLRAVEKAIGNIKRQMRSFNRTFATVHFNTSGSANAVATIRRLREEIRRLNSETADIRIRTRRDRDRGGGGGGGDRNPRRERLQNFADNGAAIAATGAGMLASVAFPVETAIKFEEAMARVKATTNATDADFQKLTQTAKNLGASTPHSAQQVAAAMNYLGMAGWKTEQIISGLPAVLNLATASGEDLARVSDIVSDDLTAFHMNADQAGHMADVMAAAATSANTNVAMMGDTFKYAGAIAGTLGYSLEDVATATGLMANAGIKGEQAGTSLRSVMTRLISPPKEAAEALDALGFSAKNADGTVKPFIQQIKELRSAMAGMTDAEKAEAGTSIAGLEALSGFMTLVNSSEEDLAKMESAVNHSGGAAQKMADTMHNTSAGAVQDFKSALEGLEIAAGGTLLPTLTELVKGITELIRTFSEFASENPQAVAGILAFVGAVGGLLAILGTVGIFLDGMISGFSALAPIIGAVWGVIQTVIGVVLGLGATTIGIIIAIIAAIVLVITYWDELKAFVSDVFTAIGEFITKAANWLSEAFNNAIEAVKGFFAGLRDFALGVLSAIGNAISEWVLSKIEWARGAIEGLKSFASGVLDGIGIGGGGSDNRSYTQNNNVTVSSNEAAAAYPSKSWFW